MKIGLTNYQDFLALVVRRKWWIVWPFLGLSAAVALLVYFLPLTYVSQVLIQVRPREVPQDYVVDLTGGTNQRLVQIQQRIFSRGVLGSILNKYGDDLPELRGLSLDAQVSHLRNQIDIALQTQQGGGVTGLRITYQNANPDVAQQIASELTDLFIAQDNEFRSSQVGETTEFLSTELETVSEELDASNRELAELRSRHQAELPEQLESNWRMLESLDRQRQANADSVDSRRELLLDLQRQLSETPATLPVDQIAAPAPPPDPRVVEYQNAVEDYRQLQLQGFTEAHPRVETALALIERLERDLPEGTDLSSLEPDETVSPEPEEVANPLHESLTAQMESLEQELNDLEKQRQDIESQIGEFNERIENTPATGEILAEAVRKNGDLQAQYSQLRGDLREAELSQRLENREEGTQFSVIDAANRPMEPSKPDKVLAVLGGMLGSLIAALAFAAAIDILRQKIWTQSEIEALWGVPVLVDIPEILTDSDVSHIRKKKLLVSTYFLGGMAVYAGLIYAVYLKHDFILTQLDPLIQRLIY